MKKHYINIAGKWAVIFAYDIGEEDTDEIAGWLGALSCPESEIAKACEVILRRNSGFTYSNDELRMSVCCVGRTTDFEQFVNTLVHEASHVQKAVCDYYDVELGSEESAYLIGYFVESVVRRIIGPS